MNTELFDAAFRLSSHSLRSQDTRAELPTTKKDCLAELRRGFPDVDQSDLEHALACAKQLEETAIKMAELDRRGDGPKLTVETISEQCPGFSRNSYDWAINDGFTMTR